MKLIIGSILYYIFIVLAVAAGYVLGEYASKELGKYLDRRFVREVAI